MTTDANQFMDDHRETAKSIAAAAREQERASIVAYLRRKGAYVIGDSEREGAFALDLADEIEKGEHLP